MYFEFCEEARRVVNRGGREGMKLRRFRIYSISNMWCKKIYEGWSEYFAPSTRA